MTNLYRIETNHDWQRKQEFSYDSGYLWQCRLCRQVHVSEATMVHDAGFRVGEYWHCP